MFDYENMRIIWWLLLGVLLTGFAIMDGFDLGVALGNVLQGVPFFFDERLRVFYTGSLWGLLNPFALLCGLVSVCMLAMHGASFLATKTEGIVRQRAIQYGRIAAIAMLLLFALAGVWVAKGLNGFVVDSMVDHAGPSNPLHKAVSMILGGWMTNYHLNPLLWIAPLLVAVAVIGQLLCLGRGQSKWGFVFSSLAIVGVISTFGLSLFPFLLPSSSHPSMSLLIWDASSSLLTLRIMLVCTVIFIPIILLYTAWVYRVMRGRVTVDSIENDSQNKY